MPKTIPFKKSEVKNYLYRCVLHWRVKDAEGDEVAKYYIDAFQSVHISLFGKLVPPNKAAADVVSCPICKGLLQLVPVCPKCGYIHWPR